MNRIGSSPLSIHVVTTPHLTLCNRTDAYVGRQHMHIHRVYAGSQHFGILSFLINNRLGPLSLLLCSNSGV